MSVARRDAPAGLDGRLPGRRVIAPATPATAPRTGPATTPTVPAPKVPSDAEAAAEEETVEGEFKEV